MRETYAISRVSCRGGRVGEAPCKVGMYARACSMPLGALLTINVVGLQVVTCSNYLLLFLCECCINESLEMIKLFHEN